MIPRTAHDTLMRMARGFPVVAVTGPRQSGKTTLARATFPDKSYLSLEDPDVRLLAESDPRGLLSRFPDGVILDEAQRSPELFSYIQTSVDTAVRPGKYVLTGSQQFGLVSGITQSLAGRVCMVQLLPFSLGELQAEGRLPADLDELMFRGLYPPLYDRDITPGDWCAGYVNTYVERDVRQLSRITDLVAFRTLAQLAALRTGQVLVTSTLARDAKLNAVTAGRYLDLLEASFLIRRLPPFLKNRSSRLVKSPKLHFTDSGLAAHMAGITTLEPGRDDLLRGALFETYMAQNLAGLLEAHLPEAQMGYWHEQGRHEVDFVIEINRNVFAIEVKAATRWNEADLSGLLAFMERTPACVAAVLAYNGKEAVKLDERLFAIPLGKLLE
ncbi:MAG: AAA family ATPase [Syntrophobacteraceae bacterium CG07_land_8_20_14_0_80_61_8]|nr:MAG: AAA family ATPase [Syntrophobacteraceae bacterium CG07_land_8_20_14_0_80_61_8]